MISATITINGVSLSVSPTDSSNYRYDDGYTAYAQDNAGYYFNDMVTIVSQYVSDIFYSVTGFIPPDFSLPFAVAGGLWAMVEFLAFKSLIITLAYFSPM